MPGGQDEPVAVGPVGRLGVVAQDAGPQDVGQGGQRHGGPGMPAVGGLRCVHGQAPDDVDGALLEGLSSNFFAIRGGALHTEEDRVLAGVTRALVLEVAERLLPVRRAAVCKDELALVEEAFITSVSREVLPVTRIDARAVGDGRVGPRTRAIMDAFAALVAREREEL